MRMRVERWICGDALDLTWAYFWQVYKEIPKLIRQESGKPWTAEEINAANIEDQKMRKDRELA